VREMDGTKLKRALEHFGLVATRKRVTGWLDA
jgi:adenylosuccinate synthase